MKRDGQTPRGAWGAAHGMGKNVRGGDVAPLSQLAHGRSAAGAAASRMTNTIVRGGLTPLDPYSSRGSRFRQSTAGIGFYRHTAINLDGLTAADRRQWLKSESKRLNTQGAIERTDKPEWDRSTEVKHPKSPRLGDSLQPIKLPGLVSWKPKTSTPWQIDPRRRRAGKSTNKNHVTVSGDNRNGAYAVKPGEGELKLPQVPGVAPLPDSHRRPLLKNLKMARSIYASGRPTVQDMCMPSNL